MNQGKETKENTVLENSSKILVMNLFMMHSNSLQHMIQNFYVLQFMQNIQSHCSKMSVLIK